MKKPWDDNLGDLDDEQIEKLWEKVGPQDFLFAISANPQDLGGEESDTIITTTPVDYFRKNKCQYDQSSYQVIELVPELDLEELIESTFATSASVKDARKALLNLGFREDKAFNILVGGMMFADMDLPRGLLAPKKKASSKLSTAVCKDEIVKAVLADPERVAAEFLPSNDPRFAEQVQVVVTEAGNPKNWKRREKRKEGPPEEREVVTLRTFDCEPFDDQLRAYVYSDADDKTILKVEIVGE